MGRRYQITEPEPPAGRCHYSQAPSGTCKAAGKGALACSQAACPQEDEETDPWT